MVCGRRALAGGRGIILTAVGGRSSITDRSRDLPGDPVEGEVATVEGPTDCASQRTVPGVTPRAVAWQGAVTFLVPNGSQVAAKDASYGAE